MSAELCSTKLSNSNVIGVAFQRVFVTKAEYFGDTSYNVIIQCKCKCNMESHPSIASMILELRALVSASSLNLFFCLFGVAAWVKTGKPSGYKGTSLTTFLLEVTCSW